MRAPRIFPSSPARLTLVAAAIFVVASQQPSFAQPLGGGAFVRAEPVTFTFPGGTLEEYVTLVKEKFGDQAQIILAPELKNLTIEPVEFKSATLLAPVQLLHHLANGQIVIDELADVWRVSSPPLHTRVFSVRDFINDKSGEPQESAMKSLISAVEATLDLGSQSIPSVKLKIHPETGLLLVSGTEKQVEIVEEVVAQLKAAGKTAEKTGKDANAQKWEAIEGELANLRAEVRQQSGDSSKGSDDVRQPGDTTQIRSIK